MRLQTHKPRWRKLRPKLSSSPPAVFTARSTSCSCARVTIRSHTLGSILIQHGPPNRWMRQFLILNRGSKSPFRIRPNNTSCFVMTPSKLKEGGYEETNNADRVVATRPRELRVLCAAARAHKSYYYRCEARSGLSRSVRNWWHT